MVFIYWCELNDIFGFVQQPGIADYSDPYDVKKQMPQQLDELSDGSAITDIADDDYSIPYNAKKNKSGTLSTPCVSLVCRYVWFT
jgi:hypothetical protein